MRKYSIRVALPVGRLSLNSRDVAHHVPRDPFADGWNPQWAKMVFFVARFFLLLLLHPLKVGIRNEYAMKSVVDSIGQANFVRRFGRQMTFLCISNTR